MLPPRGPMCDKAHHNDCWRDPRCSKALPSWVKPEVVVQIDKDKRANALRLNEAVVPRVAAEFTGAVSASGDAHAWDDEDVPAYVVDESYDADDASQAALSTPIRCSICSVAPCACDRFILGGQGFSGTAAHVQDAKCSSCDYDPCACELLALRASQRESRAMPLYVIGEPCCWLQADQTIAQGKIIAPCNVNGDARTLDKNGKSWLINSTSIWTGPAALAVGDVAATTPQNFPVARSEPGPVTRSQSMLGYGHLGTVRPLPASMTQQAGSVQPTPLQHVGTPSGPTGGLGAGRSAGDKLTASTDGKVVSTPVGGATVGPGTFHEVAGTPKTEACSMCSDDDVAPGGAEVVRPARVNPLSQMTGYVVATVMAILTLVALAGSISCVAVAISVSKAVGITSSMVLHASGMRNISSAGYDDGAGFPSKADVREWIYADPVTAMFVAVVMFLSACYINSAISGQMWRLRNCLRFIRVEAARHGMVIVAFIFIGFMLMRADAISDSEVVQFQKFVASHQDQPVVMNYFRVASQLSANWTNTIILPDYDRIDILLNAEPGDDKCEWSVFDTGAFRHVVNDPSCVVKGSIRPCNINVRGVFGGAGKAPKYMCDAIDVVKTQTGTAELLMQDAIMIETCPHPLVAGGRLAWGGFTATIAPRNRQSTLTSPGGDVIHLANRGILFIPRVSVAEGQIVAVMTPAHSNTSLFLGFSGITVAGRKNIAHWWKKLGGSRSDQFDAGNQG